jgi:acylphosphatase
MKAVIVIQGIVQGVGYRFFAVAQAKQYNVRGYTRNLPDGSVEVVAEGDQGMLNELIKKLKIGPYSAHVTGIDVRQTEEENGFTDFDIRF